MKQCVVNVCATVLFILVSSFVEAQTNYNLNSLGTNDYSSALGSENISIGANNFATGFRNEITGIGAIGLGERNKVSSRRGVAIGNRSRVTGDGSYALGFKLRVSGFQSFAIGLNSGGDGDYGFAIGKYAFARGDNSYCFGQFVKSNDISSFTIGRGIDEVSLLQNNIPSSLMIGFRSDIPTLFVGSSNGQGTTGNIGVSTDDPTEKLDVNGSIRMRAGASEGFIVSSNENGVMSWVDPATMSSISDGNGIYDGSGTIPENTIATIAENFSFYKEGAQSMNFNLTSDLGSSVLHLNAFLNGNGTSGGGKVHFSHGNALYGRIFTNSANQRLVISGENGFNVNVLKEGGGSVFLSDVGVFLGTSQTNILSTLNSNNSVGIGTINPVSKLEVDGDIAISRAHKFKFLETVGGEDRAYIRSTDGENGDYNSLVFAVGDANESMIIKSATGDVGIGTTDTYGYKLAVNGGVIATDIVVKLYDTWPDYVFEDKYALKTLSEVEAFINENNHLPEVPSEGEVKRDGINLGEMDAILLQKIEELTLYTIQQQKLIEQQGQLIEQLITEKK